MNELYKRHRPTKFEHIVGSTATVATLKNMMEKGTLPHTILFSGPSGCGKTTLARILKNELNCSELDFTELNCSNFRGIDTVREIERSIHLAPSSGKCRIWLLDEVHQMSKDGQNAALKMLEDTPKHVYFFLCTTDPQKIIKTIKTRCCEIKVESLKEKECAFLVKRTLKREKITDFDEGLISEIFDASEGSPRHILVTLDKILNLPAEARSAAITKEETSKDIRDLCQVLLKANNWKQVANVLKKINDDPESVRWCVLGYMNAVLLNSGSQRAADIISNFKDHFYDCKKAGLTLACYDSIS